jgi:hypothetical protein
MLIMACLQTNPATTIVIKHATITGQLRRTCAVVMVTAHAFLVVQKNVAKPLSRNVIKIAWTMVVLCMTALRFVRHASRIKAAGNRHNMEAQLTKVVGIRATRFAKPTWEPLLISVIARNIRNVLWDVQTIAAQMFWSHVVQIA